MAFWMYSSGSTGRPKGIVHLQHDMAYSEQAFARNVLKLTPDDICFSVPKIFFAYGFGNAITFPFSVGAATLLLPGQPKPATIFEAIEKYRPSVFYGLPTLYTSLTKADGAAATDFSSLRMALSAAEVLSADVFNGWKALTGLEIIEGLGSTEALHIYLSNRPEKKKLGAAGLRVPGYEILLRDKDGREVGDNEEGILWVRGDSNTPLYWNRPDKSAETIREGGWIYTGDRFLRDADGFHFFRGRADDLIKISGQWVYPLEVELCLAEHPDIRECAVFAAELPDRRMTLKAVVVMNKGEFDTAGRHEDAAGLRQGKAAALQISARDPVHRGIAEDGYRQDRPPGADEDVAAHGETRCRSPDVAERNPGAIFQRADSFLGCASLQPGTTQFLASPTTPSPRLPQMLQRVFGAQRHARGFVVEIDELRQQRQQGLAVGRLQAAAASSAARVPPRA